MTVRFAYYRLAFYVTVFLLSAVVLGISSYFTKLFVPEIRKDFPIFSLVVSALTIFVFLLTVQFAIPLVEAIVLLILGVLWLTMGAWSTDVIGYTQCDSVQGTVATKTGRISAQSYCYLMKVVQAFSWFHFVIFLIAFFILLRLVSQAQRFGRHRAWYEPIRELGWFNEFPGYYGDQNQNGGHPGMYTPNGGGSYNGAYPGGYPQMPMMQPQGGHSIIIQPGINGAPPTITQVPIGTV